MYTNSHEKYFLGKTNSCMRYSRLASSHEEADEYSRLLPMPDSEIGIEGSDDVYLLPSVSSTSSSTFSMTRWVLNF
ncbi:hypothetical protein B9Z55_000309 [Caenorhabditis nigoni]|uniref:Uncharacterized protein n=1 Tax=Caenorhabditis nigoni TaxID=1611254 RepID=A0A2G5VNK4_9PELO|nr:hypothetical protein B9Z55_000309 [Caenorhabditis nigoni]